MGSFSYKNRFMKETQKAIIVGITKHQFHFLIFVGKRRIVLPI